MNYIILWIHHHHKAYNLNKIWKKKIIMISFVNIMMILKK